MDFGVNYNFTAKWVAKKYLRVLYIQPVPVTRYLIKDCPEK